MRYLVLSDLHANADALDAVLTHAAGSWDRALVLGDLVGYGADPNGTIVRVRELDPLVVIRGNHDKAASGLDDARDFNHTARAAAAWTAEQLTPEHLAYLRALPAGPAQIDDGVEICHGSPLDEDRYIFDAHDAEDALRDASRPLCLFGHTHVPVIFRRVDHVLEGGAPDPDVATILPLQRGMKYLVNPGSVGQPRDGDPRAGYGVLDAGRRELMLHRVAYPVERAQRRILAAGLPPSVAHRLALGR